MRAAPTRPSWPSTRRRCGCNRSYGIISTPLLDGLRQAGPAERALRQAQVDAAVGFAAKIFGSEYAAVLLKAAAVAAHGIRRPRKPDTPLFRLILRLPRCGVAAAGPWRFARCGGPAAVM